VLAAVVVAASAVVVAASAALVVAASVEAGRVVAMVTEAAEVVKMDSVLTAPTLIAELVEKTAAGEVLDDLFLQADLLFLELVAVLLEYGATGDETAI
jgi:hypothetical protein